MRALRPTVIAALSLALITPGTISASAEEAPAGRPVRELEASLSRLEKSLTWRGSIAATYPSVDTAVRRVLKSLRRVAREQPSAVPQARAFTRQLTRLEAETGYWVRESSKPGFEPNPFLATDPLMRAALAEWSTEITEIRHDLRRPDPTRRLHLAALTTTPVSATTSPGTLFTDTHERHAMTMVVIPRGAYTAGATAQQQQQWKVPQGRRSFERPQRHVTVAHSIAAGQTEVTVGQFKQFVKETGHKPAQGMRAWQPHQDGWMDFRPRLNYLDPGFPQSDAHPVVGITKYDAQAFTVWMSRRTGHTYRLPTEGEWEYLARAGSTTAFFWGDDIESAGAHANTYDEDAFAANRFRAGSTVWDHVPDVHDGHAHTSPAASFNPNAFGLHDMTGNAREFVADTWVNNLKDASTDASVRHGQAPFIVVRGGAWNYRPQNLRTAYRNGYLSSEARTNMFGFRLVRDL
ncbi:formylglycine-generating enzyme family protein [Streptomyces zagrosensis]|uniref:Formylglycine-generating enzyme required for sulfatase activity n=1 Tax=Streptomyces zagrosensis TaxID=1042984 RepID=A0A7W9QET4_9ACTN|nr:SUMF1/EgtB/PvdO family nonheme iron enzyme [Streptomyces zagrosensis]MBB5938966.1 formylglycine-generating enzyme required for sulfatase activity [Streptomyces zagrosensis]